DCASRFYSCDGGWHDKVLDMFVDPSDSERKVYPYTAAKSACDNSRPLKYQADVWGYVKGANIPSDDELKKALCEHGPLVVAVSADGWEAYRKTDDNGNPNPAWTNYKNGVFTGKPSKSGLTMKNLKTGDIDHDVLIVGWDDDIKAWIIKNSWGSKWGDE